MKKTLITLAALAVASVASAAETLTPNQWGSYQIQESGKTWDASTYNYSNPKTDGSGETNTATTIWIYDNEASFEVAAGESVTIAKIQGGSNGNFIKVGDGILIIEATEDRAPGTLTVSDGTLKVVDNPNQRFAFNYVVNDGGTFDISGADQIHANSITLNTGATFVFGNSSILLNDTVSTLSLSSGVTFDMSAWGTTSTAFADNTTLFTNVSGLTSESPVTFDFGNGDTGQYTLSLTDGAVIATAYVAPVNPDTPAIPEPATATLSLLALAGLAARRRRK